MKNPSEQFEEYCENILEIEDMINDAQEMLVQKESDPDKREVLIQDIHDQLRRLIWLTRENHALIEKEGLTNDLETMMRNIERYVIKASSYEESDYDRIEVHLKVKTYTNRLTTSLLGSETQNELPHFPETDQASTTSA